MSDRSRELVLSKSCAYCKKNQPLTKEHIWPNGFIKRFGSDGVIYNKKVDRFFKSDPVIRDVCASCNNIKLSSLDRYLCELYDSYFHTVIAPGQPASFGYNYEKLLRGLLKISFNSARTQDEENGKIKAHDKFSDYILDGGYKPNDVQLRLLIVTSSTMHIPEQGYTGQLEPEFFRCTDISYDGPLSNRFIVRAVIIKSYWFYIVLSKRREEKAKWNRFNKGFENWLVQPGEILRPGNVKLEIPVNQTTYMHNDLLGRLVDAAS
ncbi:hypothetical protein [Oceanospirillum linum]|uniref:hypothetical protein n=1 Tax=Oceanospirillum linum TaxID=966 RepID=UPI0024BB4E3E|nr:hypothetical protein [Oceanospirillum linum]